ncbi:hypothetical protein [Haloarcula laminariae]|uniref:hypothetical protein n=1 Tax=Haloarcula laminariae TaxID=2961577 RepID=UPI0021C9B226|nr:MULTISPECIES: hypothetical protein [Halomicroarcula]
MTDSNGLERPADADAVRDEQVERALGRLANCGELTPEQRATVEQLADRLTGELLELFETDEAATKGPDAGESEPEILLCSD